ncbi:prepilin peptidase [Yersinia vastinensis]|uniref:prepilin peptidase n=1 Tax=Yersinia vastinensis TaxID=2890318 RepID=UPI0011AAB07F|nr:A24 family peptidase [Yersinia vastinensis]
MVNIYVLLEIVFFSIIGLCVGSFLNVVIYRLPIIISISSSRKEIDIYNVRLSLCLPNSFCPSCYRPLPFRYNIPLISWLLLRGISQCCQSKINPRYLIVEVLTAMLTLAVGLLQHNNYLIAASLLLVWFLIVLTFIDLDCYLLPDHITIPLLWCGLLININNIFSPLTLAVLGAVIGYGFLWLPFWLLKLSRGIEGMGYGDFKLMAALGAWFGATAIPFIVLLSSCSGVIAYVTINYFSGKKIKYIAFGPYIALSGVIYLFWGEYIMRSFLP